MRALAFRVTFAIAWAGLTVRRWCAVRINTRPYAEAFLLWPWAISTGVGVAFLRVAEALV